MSLEAQAASVVQAAFHQLDKGSLRTVVYAMVTSGLYYCNTIEVGLPLEMVWKLQFVAYQNKVVRAHDHTDGN